MKNNDVFSSDRKQHANLKKFFFIFAAVAIAVAFGAGIFFGLRLVFGTGEKPDPTHAENYGQYVFETEGFDGIESIKYLCDEFSVYSDEKSGLLGIIGTDGEIWTQAKYEKFDVVGSGLNTSTYIARPEGSTYPYIIDTYKKEVTNKQYLEKDADVHKELRWDSAASALVWYDKIGSLGKVDETEFVLPRGLYPVCGTGDTAKWGYVNAFLALDVPLKYDRALSFADGLAAVKQGDLWGYIDSDGNTVIDFAYPSLGELDCLGRDLVYNFNCSLVPVSKNGLWGIINSEGKTVVDFEYSAIIAGKNGKYVACKNDEWGIITITSVEQTSDRNSQGGTVITGGRYIVKTGGDPLNLRNAPSTQTSTVIEKIPNGTVLTVTDISDGWGYVTYNSAYGWVSMDYLTAVEE